MKKIIRQNSREISIVIIIAAYIEVIQGNFSRFSTIIKSKVKGNQEVTRL